MRRGSAGVTESPKSTNKVCDRKLHSLTIHDEFCRKFIGGE